MRHVRSQEYLDFLDKIVPEFQDYRAIVYSIINLPEQNLPFNAAKTE